MDKRAPKFSKQKYEEKILNEINFALRKDIADPRLTMVSMTHVELSPDYSQVKVFWDTFDALKKNEVEKALNGVKGKMRSILADKLDVRHVPSITFFYNSQFEDENKIEKLLKNKIEE
jgi:ribosome-binding factor A